MATLTVKMEGLQQLQTRVLKLKDGLRKKVLGAAVAAGSKVVLDAAKKTTAFKDASGDLRAAINHRRSRKFSKLDYEERHVGVFKVRGGKYANTKRNRQLQRVGKEYESDPPEYYWRFLELGTVRDPVGKPFLRPAFRASRQRAQDAIGDRLRQRLDKLLTELPK